jgi:hypothetical protein
MACDLRLCRRGGWVAVGWLLACAAFLGRVRAGCAGMFAPAVSGRQALASRPRAMNRSRLYMAMTRVTGRTRCTAAATSAQCDSGALSPTPNAISNSRNAVCRSNLDTPGSRLIAAVAETTSPRPRPRPRHRRRGRVRGRTACPGSIRVSPHLGTWYFTDTERTSHLRDVAECCGR